MRQVLWKVGNERTSRAGRVGHARLLMATDAVLSSGNGMAGTRNGMTSDVRLSDAFSGSTEQMTDVIRQRRTKDGHESVEARTGQERRLAEFGKRFVGAAFGRRECQVKCEEGRRESRSLRKNKVRAETDARTSMETSRVIYDNARTSAGCAGRVT